MIKLSDFYSWLKGPSTKQELEQSGSSKITTDANGNAYLNMNNDQVRQAMHDRMNDLVERK